MIVINAYCYNMFETRAYSIVSMAQLAPFTFTKIIWSIVFDIAVFQTYPTIQTIIGTLVIVASVMVAYKSD